MRVNVTFTVDEVDRRSIAADGRLATRDELKAWAYTVLMAALDDERSDYVNDNPESETIQSRAVEG